MHNPFIRHIVRRSRHYLEVTKDPETGEPYLKPIVVELLGERDEDAIKLPLYLKEAYDLAEEFCEVIARRWKASGFLRTLLLRRVGSSIVAGRITAEKMLASWGTVEADGEDDDETEEGAASSDVMPAGPSLLDEERLILQRFVKALEASQERDPKYAVVLECLRQRHWLDAAASFSANTSIR